MTTAYSSCVVRSAARCADVWTLFPFNATCVWLRDEGCQLQACSPAELGTADCGGVQRGARLFSWVLCLLLVAFLFLSILVRGTARSCCTGSGPGPDDCSVWIAFGDVVLLFVGGLPTTVTGITLFGLTPTDTLLAVWVWQAGLVCAFYTAFAPIRASRPNDADQAAFVAWRANLGRVHGVGCGVAALGLVCTTFALFWHVTPQPPSPELWLFYPFCSHLVSKTTRTETRASLLFYVAASTIALRQDLIRINTLVPAQICFVAFDVGLFECRLVHRAYARRSFGVSAAWSVVLSASVGMLLGSFGAERSDYVHTCACVVLLGVCVALVEARESVWPWKMIDPPPHAPPTLPVAAAAPVPAVGIVVVGHELTSL